MRKLYLLIGITAAAIYLLSTTLFTVYPWESRLVLQFGEIVGVHKDPGLYFKLPWQTLKRFDSRILTIDSKDPDRFITSEKENVLVDSYIKWRIVEPAAYYTTMQGLESQAEVRLQQIINRGLRDEFGKRTVKEVVSGQRDEVMRIMRDRANQAADRYGIQVADVRIKRVELPQQVSENVYRNMIEERRRVANERRSEGDAEKEKIMAVADKERVVLLAEAVKEAEKIKGKGDAISANIYAKAYETHPEFYAFYRSLQAYERSLGHSSDLMILKPDSDFFKYFNEGLNPAGQ